MDNMIKTPIMCYIFHLHSNWNSFYINRQLVGSKNIVAVA